jgi:sec-independent protein translocase protein TatB
MFEVGFTEILLISVLALVVLGPEKLPRVAAQVGRWMGRARAMARQFREQLEDEVQVAEANKAKAAPAPGSESTAAPSATAAAPAEPVPPVFTGDTSADSVSQPPEVAAADAAAAETAHSENTPAPAAEPEASVYQPTGIRERRIERGKSFRCRVATLPSRRASAPRGRLHYHHA